MRTAQSVFLPLAFGLCALSPAAFADHNSQNNDHGHRCIDSGASQREQRPRALATHRIAPVYRSEFLFPLRSNRQQRVVEHLGHRNKRDNRQERPHRYPSIRYGTITPSNPDRIGIQSHVTNLAMGWSDNA